MTIHSYQISLKDRGRIVIPAKLRREAGFSEEVELVATPLAEGGFIVKTRQQILESLWERSLSMGSVNAIGELLSERDAVTASRLNELENPVIASESELAEREGKILTALGL